MVLVGRFVRKHLHALLKRLTNLDTRLSDFVCRASAEATVASLFTSLREVHRPTRSVTHYADHM